MQHKAQLNAALQPDGTFDYSGCFTQVTPEIEAADIAICNFETTLGGAPYSGYPQFCSPDAYALAIRDAGFDILLTANNHCMDRRNNGLIRTLDVLDSLGVKHLGTYRNQAERDSLYPYIIEHGSMRIALLNYTYDTNGIPVAKPCGQGQSQPSRDRRLQEARRLLPRLDRRPRRHPRPGQHQEHRMRGVSGTRDGSHLEDPGRKFPGLHPRGRQGQRLLQDHRPVMHCGTVSDQSENLWYVVLPSSVSLIATNA